ncbi:glycoside hydrolase family 30 beta sandwich domain-containing protein [Neobacillus niacini]|uniref:glycoside hydrolase family 30 beta sandwich domain-containing protein n=1 Tax=Neobacillus niacini TaxID=86668 RepID=UPI001EE711ED|nr:glycoside hydrolase family 30 beta sandwich domain-containing protein [Neobacillus niacini]
MITIDPATREIIWTPEFYVMKYFAHAVQSVAVRIGLPGNWSSNAVAFLNPNGQTVIVAANSTINRILLHWNLNLSIRSSLKSKYQL